MSDFEIINGVLIKYTGQDNIVNIPNSVKTIGEFAFWGREELTSITSRTQLQSLELVHFQGARD